MTELTTKGRDEFLAKTRIGILTSLQADGGPIAVPVWFDWDGVRARIFTSASSQKVKRIEEDPRVSLLVVNDVGEPETWVAIDAEARIEDTGGAELARRLADRYWDMNDPDHKATVDMWVRGEAMLRILVLDPTAIRSSGG